MTDELLKQALKKQGDLERQRNRVMLFENIIKNGPAELALCEVSHPDLENIEYEPYDESLHRVVIFKWKITDSDVMEFIQKKLKIEKDKLHQLEKEWEAL